MHHDECLRYVRRLGHLLVIAASVQFTTIAAAQPWGYDPTISEYREIDGSGNSIGGAAHTPLLRKAMFADYPDDGSGETMMGISQRENPRIISNSIAAQGAVNIPNTRGMSDYAWAWGQFLDHDIDLTEVDPVVNGTADIALEHGDPLYAEGVFEAIPFARSDYESDEDGIRQQVNQITAFVDASNVYGSDETTAMALRTAGGRLATSDGNLLPIVGGMFFAGDVRANENVMLTSLHTLFMREHNRLAGLIKLLAPEATDDEIYQLARKIVGAEIQLITYQEFLPTLLGSHAPALNTLGYNSTVDPSIANEFSTAFYRFGHSLLSPQLVLAGLDGPQESLPLRDAFFQPQVLINDPINVDRLLAGATLQLSQDVDNKIVDDVRNFLFGDPGQGGMDLASLNIQRGRDHGIPDYNTLRDAYGLAPGAYPGGGDVSTTLEILYGSSDNIDAWVGGLAETHLPGSSVGELINASLVDQFSRLMQGDRLSVQNDIDLDLPIISAAIHLDAVSLASVIRANTQVRNLRNDVFTVGSATDADVIATYNETDNRVHITGNALDNRLSIFEMPFGLVLAGSRGTLINGQPILVLVAGEQPHLTIDMGAGKDNVTVIFCQFGDCVVSLGDDNDVLTAFASSAARLAVDGGGGNNNRYNDGIVVEDEDLIRLLNVK